MAAPVTLREETPSDAPGALRGVKGTVTYPRAFFEENQAVRREGTA